DDWRARWLRFASGLSGVGDVPDPDDRDACELWIDTAAAAFARQFQMTEQFRAFWRGGGVMPLVRRLNGAGIGRLVEVLGSLRTNAPQGVPTGILTHLDTSQTLGVNVEIQAQTFGTRFLAAQYLNERFAAAELQDVERDCGIWAWLALFYFEELCPAGAGGR